MVAKAQVLSMMRACLRQARHFDNYNFRAHAMRRVIGGFRESKKLEGQAAEEKFKWGQDQLRLLKRQRTISEMFPEEMSIMQG